MMKEKFCVLFSGIDSLKGTTAIHLVTRFKLKEYGGVKVGHRGKYFYADFDAEIDRENSLGNLHSFIGLLEWLGIQRIKYRIDRAHIADSQVDFQLHMIQETSYIKIPKPLYAS